MKRSLKPLLIFATLLAASFLCYGAACIDSDGTAKCGKTCKSSPTGGCTCEGKCTKAEQGLVDVVNGGDN